MSREYCRYCNADFISGGACRTEGAMKACAEMAALTAENAKFKREPNLIRTVATAICKSRTCEGVSCCQWPAQGGRTQCPVRDGGYDDAARDALIAVCAHLVESQRDTGSTISTIKKALAVSRPHQPAPEAK